MTQPILADNVLELLVEGVNEGTPWAMVRHYLVTAAADADALLEAMDIWAEEALAVALKGVCTDDWEAHCNTISRVAPNPMNVHFNNFAAPVVGDITTDGVPNQAAVLIRLMTSEVGPRNRGRVFVCGAAEAQTDGGRLTAAGLGNWEAAQDVFKQEIDDGAGNTVVPVIFSRTQYALNPAAAVTTYTAVIDNVQTQANLATIRRRRYPRSVPS